MSTPPSLSVTLRANGRHGVETLLATVAIGLADAIREGCISAAEAADLFFIDGFLPFSDSKRLASHLVEALHAGSELEDVERLAPKGLPEALDTIRKNALATLRRRGAGRGPVRERWIQRSRTAHGAARGRRPRRP